MSANIEQIYTANPITTNMPTDLMYFGRSPYGSSDNTAMTFANFSAQFGATYTPSALTRTNDTNVTLTLGGTPTTALLQGVSLTLGWSGTLAVSRGGLGVSSTPSNGQIPIGNGTGYNIGYLTAGSGISIANAAGSITINSTGSSLTIVPVNTNLQACAANELYIALVSGQTTFNLPSTYAVGTRFAFVGSSLNTGGWSINANTGAKITVNNAVTSASGSVTSAAIAGQTLELICDVANTSLVAYTGSYTTLTTS